MLTTITHRKRIFNTNCKFNFSLQLLFETIFILIFGELHMSYACDGPNAHRSSCMVSITAVSF
jgi:hypothetical protein